MATEIYASIKTVSEQIKKGNSIELNIANFHTKDVLNTTNDKIVVNTLSILNNYMYFLKQYITEIKLDINEIQKYAYKPKLLCYDIYNTIEYYDLILRVNNMDSVMDFSPENIKTLKVFGGDISGFLNEVKIKEKNAITANNNTVREETA